MPDLPKQGPHSRSAKTPTSFDGSRCGGEGKGGKGDEGKVNRNRKKMETAICLYLTRHCEESRKSKSKSKRKRKGNGNGNIPLYPAL